MASALVIGYGNALRSDDGIGWQVAALLLDDSHLGATDVLCLQQLTPELALDVSRASTVVFVDASVDVAPGLVGVRPVEPAAVGSTWSHHLTPGSLLALSDELFGAAPPASIVSVGVESTDVGEHLSATVAAALPVALAAVRDLIETAGHA